MAISGLGGASFSPSASFAFSTTQREIVKDLIARTPKNFVETDSSQGVSNLISQEDGVLISARLGDVSRANKGASLSTLFTIGLAQANSAQLKSIKDTLGSMKELSEKAESTTLSTDERSVISSQFTDLRESLETTLRDAAYNGTKIFQDKTIETVINEDGATEKLKLEDLSLGILGLTDSSLADSTQAATATTSLTSAQSEVDERIAYIDTQLSKFNFHITNTLNNRSVVNSSSQRFDHFSSAEEGVSQMRNDILSSASVLSQANINRFSLADLLDEP